MLKLVGKRGVNPADAAWAARHLIEELGRAFDDACVEGWEPLDGSYGLPDPDDEHLVAAAVVGGAGAIVTLNVKDLPANKVPPHIQVKSPAEFALETVELAPELALLALQFVRPRRHRPGLQWFRTRFVASLGRGWW